MNLTKLGKVLRLISNAFAEFTKAVKAMDMLAAAFHQNDEVWLSGQESKYFIRAALDPAYASEQDLDRLLADLLRLPGFTKANRARMAAAALSGWVQHRDTQQPSGLVWFRVMDHCALQVVAA